MEPAEDVETICRGILQRTSAREHTVSPVAPDTPSVDYLSGFAAGRLDGQMATAALVLGLLTGESPTKVLEEAQSQAAVEAAFPFDLHIDEA